MSNNTEQNLPDLPGVCLEDALAEARLLTKLTGEVHGASVKRDGQTGYIPLTGEVWEAVKIDNTIDGLPTLRNLNI
jgi:hypothetical protein